MPVHARDWIELHELLKVSVGEETAARLMDFLPPAGWADVATKDDLRALETSLRGDMAELKGEFAELKGEFAELKGEFAELKGEFAGMKGEFASQKGDILKWVTGISAMGMAMSAGIAAAVASVIPA